MQRSGGGPSKRAGKEPLAPSSQILNSAGCCELRTAPNRRLLSFKRQTLQLACPSIPSADKIHERLHGIGVVLVPAVEVSSDMHGCASSGFMLRNACRVSC